MATAVKYTNSDGLDVHYNALVADNKVPATLGSGAGGRKTYEFIVKGTALGTTVTPDGRGAVIPAGARVVSSSTYVSEAFTSGGSATLTIGLYKVSDDTAYDADGIDATIAVAALTNAAVIANDGAVIGAKVTEAVRFGSIYGTAAFTAGLARVQVIVEDPAVQTAS